MAVPGLEPDLDPVRDVRAAVRACRARDYNMDGIPMFLAPEDLAQKRPGESGTQKNRLVRLAQHYLDELGGEPARAADALEVLAAHHFGSVAREAGGGPFLRAVNFHNTPRARRGVYERQILDLGERFAAVDEAGIHALLSGETPSRAAPGVLPVFYEGYRNNYEVALPLLERAGLRGWFFVVTGFVDAPVEDQYAFGRAHHIGLAEDNRPGERCAMTWDELRDVVARGHVAAAHTATHCAVYSVRTPEDVRRELVEPRERLESELEVEVRTLAWLLGAPYGTHPWAEVAAREAGYRLLFSNTKVQRMAEP
jgi:hypothetical protein